MVSHRLLCAHCCRIKALAFLRRLAYSGIRSLTAIEQSILSAASLHLIPAHTPMCSAACPELHWHRLARTSANSQSCQNCQSPPRLAAEHLFAEMAHHELSLRAVRFTGCDQVALCSLQSRQPIQSSCAPYRRGAAALRRLDGSVSAKKASTLTIEGFLLLNSDLTSTFQTLD